MNAPAFADPGSALARLQAVGETLLTATRPHDALQKLLSALVLEADGRAGVLLRLGATDDHDEPLAWQNPGIAVDSALAPLTQLRMFAEKMDTRVAWWWLDEKAPDAHGMEKPPRRDGSGSGLVLAIAAPSDRTLSPTFGVLHAWLGAVATRWARAAPASKKTDPVNQDPDRRRKLHRLNNVLSAITVQADLGSLLMETQGHTQAQELFEEIGRQGVRCAEEAERLLERPEWTDGAPRRDARDG